MPSLSQYGDAESYKIGSPEETAEWYADEVTDQMQVYEPKSFFWSHDKNLFSNTTFLRRIDGRNEYIPE